MSNQLERFCLNFCVNDNKIEKEVAMDFKKTKANLPLFASIIVLIFYGISFSGIVYEPLGFITGWIVNRDAIFSLTKGEVFIEWMEAIFWLSAFTIYLTLFIRNYRANKWETLSFWYLFLVVWCFVVFGEEISWGQHIFGFDSPDYMKEINDQRETNLHNINIANIIGLPKDSTLYPYFAILYKLPQYAFYLICIVVWVVIPTLKMTGTISHSKIIQSVPVHSKGIVFFLGLNLIAYILIDKLFFDAGEIFELALSLTAIISALDLWFLRSNGPAVT